MLEILKTQFRQTKANCFVTKQTLLVANNQTCMQKREKSGTGIENVFTNKEVDSQKKRAIFAANNPSWKQKKEKCDLNNS